MNHLQMAIAVTAALTAWPPPVFEAAGAGAASPAAAGAPDGPAATTPPEVIPAGTRLDVTLEQALATGSTQADDRWSGTLTHAIMDGDRVLVAPGARITGIVTAAGPLEVDGEIRQILAVEPRELDVKGRSVPIRAAVVAAVLPGGDGRAAAADVVLVGEGAGGGRLAAALGGPEGEALLRASLGGSAATAIAVSLADAAIEIPRGSTLTLSLEEAVEM